MDNNVKMVPALCTQCGGTVEVNKDEKSAKCPYCGMTFVIEQAVNNYNVQYAKIEHADNVNIDMSGTVKNVLDFVGDQMKEGRKARQELKKERIEKDKAMNAAFMKMFGYMMIGMFVFAVVAFIIMQFT